MTAGYNVPTDDLPVRSLYMRLFRAWLDGDDFYHEALVDGHIHRLLAAGHVERCGQGYRITDAGKQAWAQMNAPLMSATSSRAKQSLNLSYIKALKQFYVESGEDNVSSLMSALKVLLEKLNETGDWTDVAGTEKTVLMTASRQKYVESRGKGIFRITDAGQGYLGFEPVQRMKLEKPPVDDFNADALIHRLLAGLPIMRAELTAKGEREFMNRLVREVHVTVAGDGYVITRAGRAALENFGQDAPAKEKDEPPVTAFSEPVAAADPDPVPGADAKPAKRAYTRREAPVKSHTNGSAGSVTAIPVAVPAEVQPPRFAGNRMASTLVPVSNRPEPAPEHDCDGKECLPCRVLAAVMDEMPEVRDLFEAMKAQEIILKNLGKR